jgi:transcription-repair coupling factor (superfamily II helicase)
MRNRRLPTGCEAIDAQRLLDEIPWFAPDLRVRLLPDWETLPYDSFSPHHDLFPSAWRRSTRSCAASATCCWCPPRRRSTASRRRPIWPPTPSFSSRARRSTPTVPRAADAGRLYARHQVVAPGEYSIRGGLVDLFPMGSQLPYRLDLFDDESRASRPSTSTPAHALSGTREIRLLPAREFPLDDKGRTRFRQRFREVFEGDPARRGSTRTSRTASPSAGIEYWLPLFFEETATLFDYLPGHRALPAQRRARGDPRLLARGAVALRHALRRPQPPAAAAGRTLPGRGSVLHRRQARTRAVSLGNRQ